MTKSEKALNKLKAETYGILSIDIKEPIWKTVAVGICLDGADADNLIELTISYKYKKGVNKGRLKFPHKYYIKASQVPLNSIKTHQIQGKTIHEVKISSLITGEMVQDELLLRIKSITDDMSTILEESKQRIGQQKNPEKKVAVETITAKTDQRVVPFNNIGHSSLVNEDKPKNKNNMSKLFDSSDIENIRKQNSERGGAFLKRLEIGAHHCKLQEVEVKNAKSDNAPMIIMKYFHDPQYHTLDVLFKLDGKGSEISRNKFVEHLESAYGYQLQPSESIEDVAKQLKQFIGKSCEIAVKHRKRLYELKAKDGGDPEVVIIRQPEYWYSGPAGTTLSFNPAKAVDNLDKKDMTRYEKLTELNGKSPRDLYLENKENNENPLDDDTVETDEGHNDLPF